MKWLRIVRSKDSNFNIEKKWGDREIVFDRILVEQYQT